jgi:3-hydroxybutyryl-CoA dehydrogenase
MGHGIAQVAALAGYQVHLNDLDSEQVVAGRGAIESNLSGGVDRGKVSPEERDGALSRIRGVLDLEEAVDSADLVVEAIVENLEIKRGLFAKIEALAPESSVLASNTSSLPIGKIATALRHPERMIGMHFFNPVHIMALVEVVVHPGTSEAVRDRVLEVVRRMGKEPIVVQDSPGFASSRLGVVLGLEAMRMLEQGVASAEDIDKAMVLGYRHPVGPLKLTDLVGLDVRLAVAETLHREIGGATYEPPEILRNKVASGHLGKKAGQGFYTW